MTGKFDLRQNPFALLAIQPTASNQGIVDAFEDALAERRASESDLNSAGQTLLKPKTRLEAELTSLLDTPSGEAHAIFDRLRAGSDDLALRQLLPRLAPLSQLNLVTHLATNEAVTAELLISFVESLSEIEISAVLATLERTRKSAGFISPDPASTREALHSMYAQHASSVLDAYQRREIAARDVTQCVKATLIQSDAGRIDALEILLRADCLVVQVDLSRIRDDIEKAAADLKTPFSSTAEQKL